MTIKEIAQLAQVSSAAVSRYLNGGYISEEKKERIRAAIEKTGYHPSAQARNLRTKRARLIGVVAPRLSSESVARVTDGIGEVLGGKAVPDAFDCDKQPIGQRIGNYEAF
ncbi:MAG: LacI family DNA-binding transcriptional regulator [Sellimonas intestinalis]